jgi:thiamine biosynthesis protein ThiS
MARRRNCAASFSLPSEVSQLLLIQVNSEPREVKENISLPELVASLSLKAEQVAIELNQRVVRRAQWESTILHEADKVEIVYFVGGGLV